MARTRIPWTAAMIACLVEFPGDYDAYRERFPHGHSWEAWRTKSNRMGLTDGSGNALADPQLPEVLGLEPETTPEEDLATKRRRWALLEEASSLKTDPSRRYIPAVFPRRRHVVIAFIGDTHIGGNILWGQLRADLGLIAQEEVRAVFTGDLLDNYKPQSKAGTALYYAPMADPNEAVEWAVDAFAPTRGKWLGFSKGNHDNWDAAYAGIERIADFAARLDAPLIEESGASIEVVVGEQAYRIAVKHTWVGTSRISKANTMRRLYAEWPWLDGETPDVVCVAHTHEPDIHHTIMHGREVVMMRSGTYKVSDPYAEKHGFKPVYGVPAIVLFGDERRMEPFMSVRSALAYVKGLELVSAA